MSQSLFSDDLLSFIEEWKNKPGNLIMVLHRVQSEIGYISREAADEVSRLLDVPLATIWGVVTFYHFFKLNKPGKYNIQVCLGTACYLKGGDMIIEELGVQKGLDIMSAISAKKWVLNWRNSIILIAIHFMNVRPILCLWQAL